MKTTRRSELLGYLAKRWVTAAVAGCAEIFEHRGNVTSQEASLATLVAIGDESMQVLGHFGSTALKSDCIVARWITE